MICYGVDDAFCIKSESTEEQEGLIILSNAFEQGFISSPGEAQSDKRNVQGQLGNSHVAESQMSENVKKVIAFMKKKFYPVELRSIVAELAVVSLRDWENYPWTSPYPSDYESEMLVNGSVYDSSHDEPSEQAQI